MGRLQSFFIPFFGVLLILRIWIFPSPMDSYSQPYRKTLWLRGVYKESSSDATSFLIQNEETGKIFPIQCHPSVVNKMKKETQKGSVLVSLKAEVVLEDKNITYHCLGDPIFRRIQSESSLREIPVQDKGYKYISGQVLNADPETGLLTIQTGTRKTFLKINPTEALQIQKKLESLQVHSIEGYYSYDRNLGYYVKQQPPGFH